MSYTLAEAATAVGMNKTSILRAIKSERDALRRAFILTLFYTGCRISEALNVTKERLDETAGSITFESANGPNADVPCRTPRKNGSDSAPNSAKPAKVTSSGSETRRNCASGTEAATGTMPAIPATVNVTRSTA